MMNDLTLVYKGFAMSKKKHMGIGHLCHTPSLGFEDGDTATVSGFLMSMWGENPAVTIDL